MKGKATNLLIYVISVLTFTILTLMFLYSIKYPVLTQMQIFLRFDYLVLIDLVLFVILILLTPKK